MSFSTPLFHLSVFLFLLLFFSGSEITSHKNETKVLSGKFIKRIARIICSHWIFLSAILLFYAFFFASTASCCSFIFITQNWVINENQDKRFNEHIFSLANLPFTREPLSRAFMFVWTKNFFNLATICNKNCYVCLSSRTVSCRWVSLRFNYLQTFAMFIFALPVNELESWHYRSHRGQVSWFLLRV